MVGNRILSMQEPKQQIERRRWPRYPIEAEVKIIARGKMYRTFSDNVSGRGLLLQSPLPLNLEGEVLTIFAAYGDFRATFKGKIVGQGQVHIAVLESYNQLERLVESVWG